jgi:DNA (cytosine-5)-methyltransferase 1
MNYYNENDRFAADWLQNLIAEGLIPDGKVDRRSIKEVGAADVREFAQCHFFAGIGGWSLALQLAGWSPDRPVWTGSCPCQPFSQAGKQKAQADERHLWPEMFRLIRECQPYTVFGEQVASAIGHGWLDGISDNLEEQNYAVGSAVLVALSVGAPHKRSRLFWVANSASKRGAQHVDDSGKREAGREDHTADCCGPSGVADSSGERKDGLGDIEVEKSAGVGRNQSATGSDVDAVGDASVSGLERRITSERQDQRSSWSPSVVVACLDEKSRRVGCSVQPLAHGIPARKTDLRMGCLVAKLAELGFDSRAASKILRESRSNRIGRLRGYGNAIVPQVAAEFVIAFMECKPN